MKRNLRGGEFLLRKSDPAEIFVPEEWTEEQHMLRETILQFIAEKVHPILNELDQRGPEIIPGLLDQAAELGMLSLTIPEKLGGMGIGLNTDLLMTEAIGSGFSFATSIGVQTGIGMIPILYYGSPEQKAKYLPGIGAGEWKPCYCLTEPDAGSDANSGKTKATPDPATGGYKINGQKMWITNGGFSNLFIVFAKIEDDENLSAFIIEESYGGIERGDEEKKLGIKGSSTVQLFFNDVPVPAENLLGKRGEGFKIALNTLNIGRIKLGAGVIGGIKFGIGFATEYARERKQFGKSLIEFGAIQHKIGEMASRSFACESAVYRAGQDIEDEMATLIKEGMDPVKAKMKSVEQYVIECSIMKIYGSETVDFVVDEGVQIFGGMGFSEDGPMARAYRDSRILRIFEGTNEINRMLTVGMFFRKVAKTKELSMKEAVSKLPFTLAGRIFGGFPGSSFAAELRMIEDMKRIFLLVGGKAASQLKLKLVDEQETLLHLADVMIQAYVAESAVLRAQKCRQKNYHTGETLTQMENMAKIVVYEAMETVRKSAKDAILAFSSGFNQKFLLWAVNKLSRTNNINIKNLRREVADFIVEKGKYPF